MGSAQTIRGGSHLYWLPVPGLALFLAGGYSESGIVFGIGVILALVGAGALFVLARGRTAPRELQLVRLLSINARRVAMFAGVPAGIAVVALWITAENGTALRNEVRLLAERNEQLEVRIGEDAERIEEDAIRIRDMETEITRLADVAQPTERERHLQEEVVNQRAAISALEANAADLQAEVGKYANEAAHWKQQAAVYADRISDLDKKVTGLVPSTGNPVRDLMGFAMKNDLRVRVGHGGVSVFAPGPEYGEGASDYYKELAAVAEGMKYTEGLAIASEYLSNVQLLAGDKEAAKAAHATAVERALEAGGAARPITVYDNLSFVQGDAAQLDTAEKFHQAALQLAKTSGFNWGIGAANLDLGVIAQFRGDLDAATAYYDQSAKVFLGDGQEIGAAMAYWNLVSVYGWKKNAAEVQTYLSEVEKLLSLVRE